MKTCNKCNISKSVDEFYKRDNGYRNECKDCLIKKSKEWASINKDKRKSIMQKYYLLNSNDIREKTKKYQSKNRDKDRVRRSKYRKIRQNNYINRISNDVLFKLSESIRASIKTSIRKRGYTKRSKTYIILGCSYEEFRIYIESKFEKWMNWDNYGKYNGELNYGWDFDHIMPISSAKTESDVINLNHVSNFQPLCSKVNRDIKKDKIIQIFLDYQVVV